MKHRLQLTLAGITLVAIVVSGCGGALALVAGGLAALKARDMIGDVKDLISGQSPTTYRVFMDGAEMGVSPDVNGTLNLLGIPVGPHLFAITSADQRMGWVQVQTVPDSGTAPDFKGINAITGGLIKGKVMRTATGGGQVAVAGQVVFAVRDGDQQLHTGAITFPPYTLTGAEAWMAGFTDGTGAFTLGPAAYGRWLLVAVRPDYLADAAVVSVAAGSDPVATTLTLQPDATQTAGAIQGSVTNSASSPLTNALVTTTPGSQYGARLNDTAHSKIATAAGGTLVADPWFVFNSFSAVSDASGQYQIAAPVGSQTVTAFKYGYKGQAASAIAVTADGLSRVDFALPNR